MNATQRLQSKVFHLVLIKPTHYDDEGYPLQWRRSTIPSNALACVNGIAEDCRDRAILGEDVDIRIWPWTRRTFASGRQRSSR
jgi:hypothetical protein